MGTQKRFDPEQLLSDPRKAANEIDAILYFIQQRYRKGKPHKLPKMENFIISKIEVIFSSDADHIFLWKNLDLGSLEIHSPNVPESQREERTIYLLGQFGDLLSKAQAESVAKLRQILVGMLDNEGRRSLVQAYIENQAAK